jgi:hypothetical protein
VSHRFGSAAHHYEAAGRHFHDGDQDEHEAASQSWDGFVEVTGEWEGRQRIAGALEEASGGKSIWFTPGARFNSAGGLSVAVAAGIPVWQRIRLSHPDNDYRLTLSIGHAF